MRPLELRLRGFRSYRAGSETVFDFRGRRLVGIVGPIGSGKSSILDAVSFALYGRTAGVTRDTRSLIHQRADGGTVALRFEVDGQTWQAVRALRAKGQSQHVLYRYDADGEDPQTAETVTGERDVNDRVAALLGMDYDAFARSVLLAQGEFDRFLTAPPVGRDKVLKGVFGYERVDRMREAAREKVRELELEMQKVALQLEQLERIAGELNALRLQHGTAVATVARLEAARPQLVALDEAVAQADAAMKEVGRRLQEIAGLRSRIPERASVTRVVAGAEASASHRRQRAAELETAQAAVQVAAQAVRQAEGAGERELLETASSLLAVLQPQRAALAEAERRTGSLDERARTLAEQHQRSLATQQEARAAAGAAEQVLVAAEARLTEAEQVLHEARHAEMAVALRRELRPGAECPVCSQPVARVPPAGDAMAIEAAEQALQQARTDRDRLAKAARDAAADVAAAAAAVTGAERSTKDVAADLVEAKKAIATAADAVVGSESEVRALLGDGDPDTLLRARRDALRALDQGLASARVTAEEVGERHAESIVAQQETSRELAELRVALAAAAARLGDETAIAADDTAALTAAAERLAELWEATSRALETQRATAEKTAVAAGEERRALLGELDAGDGFEAALAGAQARVAVMAEAIERDEKLIADRDAVVTSHEGAASAKALFERLSSDLTDSRFIRYLLEEERARLAELGSDEFQRLSGGRYRFTDDGRFDIVDLAAADAVRKSESLSGGETFLASLALAIALAEMVARTGGRLDAFFLDEGFGSLDPEHLDLAMEGIEALVADHDDRLVVVVSHVPEMRQRMEDLIVLDRDDVTGDTIVRRGAGRAG